MPRIKLTVAYDGTDFRGWAAQRGQRTVQATLTDAIARATGLDLEVVGASRTDSGAHARGAVCHFDCPHPIPAQKWHYLLNRLLPSDLVVKRSAHVGEDFHSRFCAEDRWYRYRIRTIARDPFESRWAHDHGRELDVEQMQLAGKVLEGTHDFLAFTEELDPRIDNTVRTLKRVRVRQVPGEVWIDIVGTAFLRGMMRRISGGLLEVGRGHRRLNDMYKLVSKLGWPIASVQWPVVLPAKGLCLMRVRYADPPRDHREER